MELLIAIGIFTFGALAILALFNAAMVAHRSAIDRSTAALVAQNVVAAYRMRFRGPVRPKDWSMLAPEADADYPAFRYQVFLQPISDSRNLANPGLYDTYVLVVDIYWGPERRPMHERFRTVIIRHGDLDQ